MVVLRGDLIKCVVIGDDNVGKTSMLMNYATNRFPSQHVPSVFDNYAGSVNVSGKPYTLQLIDTSEQDDSDESRRLCYTGADIFVVCFSVCETGNVTERSASMDTRVAQMYGRNSDYFDWDSSGFERR